ncbi:MAG: hypothetical protein AAF367_09940 [Pseudomonadota bacterium]
MTMTEATPRAVPLRPAAEVMRLASMGAFHQTRLSFMRILMRRLRDEAWAFDRPVWRVDATGVGHAVYRAKGPERTYSLIAFAHDLPDHLRSDRVIAEAWDATFTLFDGEPTADDVARLAVNVPLQEAGRITAQELTLSRANRSVRLFGHVVDRLADGKQPDAAEIDAVGYLMRTTAVYGSGKFGASDRCAIAARPECAAPFQAEMLSVFLIRAFTVDIAEHLARARNPDAARLAPHLRRRLGVGNSTGLGMAPFLIRHPLLIDHWVRAREEALARVRSVREAKLREKDVFSATLTAARAQADTWNTTHPLYEPRVAGLRGDLERLETHIRAGALNGDDPWDRLYRWTSDTLTAEGRELTVSMMMEPNGHLIDGLTDCMSADEGAYGRLDGTMRIADLRALVERIYGFALATDFDAAPAQARCWYVSAEKLEPRLGERAEEPIEPYEQPLAPARDAVLLHRAMAGRADDELTARFVMAHPEHRAAARRAQIAATFPFAEIRDNTIAAEMLPIDLLRCKLSFFGATKFDPRSDRWVRITMFQGAPYPDEMPSAEADAWSYSS